MSKMFSENFSLCNFIKILVANQRLLLGHRVLVQTHISHAL